MKTKLRTSFWHRAPRAPWDANAPVREELFGIERLEQHAESLAAAQLTTLRPRSVLSLQNRLNENADVLLATYRESACLLYTSFWECFVKSECGSLVLPHI